MKIFKTVLAIFLMLSLTDVALAKGTKKTPAAAKPTTQAAPAAAATPAPASGSNISPYPWGMAGCGLGAKVIHVNAKGPQIGAYFLNALTFSVSSVTSSRGSSNCNIGPDLKTAKVETEVYMDVNYAQLKRDAAQGGGYHLSAFYQILGCDDAVQKGLAGITQSHYNTIFSQDNTQQAVNELRHLASQNYGDSCPRAGEV